VVYGEPMELAYPGFSIYLTLSWPNPRAFTEILGEVLECVDFIELGLPSKDPIYDGPVIRRTHIDVARAGVTVWRAVESVRGLDISVPIIFMGYLREHRGHLDRLLSMVRAAGGVSILFPDLPFEYPHYIKDYTLLASRAGLRPSFFASSKFPHRMLEYYASLNPLLIYLGLQMATGIRLPARMLENVRLARRIIGDRYLLAGFSIKSGGDAVNLVKAGASGVVVGSRIRSSV